MGKIVIMPKQGLQMTEGLITQWLAAEGDAVKAGEPLFEMETDKLSITIDSPADGTLLKILCQPEETASVGAPIAVIGAPGEDVQAILNGDNQEAAPEPKDEPAPADKADGHVVIMPKQGLQMTMGLISAWLVQEGQAVQEGEPLFEMETDKLSIAIDAPASGTLLKILCDEGETAEVAAPIAVIGPAGADYRSILDGKPAAEAVAKPTPAAENRVFSTPRARTRAQELEMDYCQITGSGPDGLIIERDVLNAAAERPAPAPAPVVEAAAAAPSAENVRARQIPISSMRRIIAQRMLDSLNTLAQACHRLTVDMSAAVALREQFKAADVKISYNDIVLRCVAKALTEFPMMNATMDDQFITLRDYVNLGMAVATDNGLLVPVIRDADKKTLPEIARESKDLALRTKNGTLTPDELSGGTFTVTNLGMFDIESFTAVINKPEAGILAVGKLEKKPVVVDDAIVIRPMMQLSLTYDHRILDGAPAAQFLRRVKQLLEHPGLML